MNGSKVGVAIARWVAQINEKNDPTESIIFFAVGEC
jgi:hypothetical protein